MSSDEEIEECNLPSNDFAPRGTLSCERYEQILYHFGRNDVRGMTNVLQDLKVVPFREPTYLRNFIHLAAIQGSAPCLRYFINAGCDVNLRDILGYTPLMLTIRLCDSDYRPRIIRQLLRAGASTSILSRKGQSAFNMCFLDDPNSMDDLLSAKIILKAGWDINEKYKGVTVLERAVRSYKVESVRFLLHNDAKLVHRDPGDETLLHDATAHVERHRLLHLADVVVKRRSEISEMLLKKGADPNAIAESNLTTPFHNVLRFADLRTVKLFLEYGAVWNKVDARNRGSIHFAAMNYRTEVLKYVIEKGRGTDDLMKEDDTTLHIATMSYAIHNMKYLIQECGVDPNTMDRNGETPLLSICAEISINGIPERIRLYELEYVIQTLVDLGAKLNLKDDSGQFLFSRAALSRDARVCSAVIRFLARQQYQRKNIGKDQYRMILEHPVLNKFYQLCFSELEYLKKGCIDTMPLWPLFNYEMTEELVMKYTRNEKFVDIMKNMKHSQVFPIYGYFLTCNFKRLMLTKDLKREAFEALNKLLPFEISHDLIVREILSYLSVSDQAKIVHKFDKYAILANVDELVLDMTKELQNV